MPIDNTILTPPDFFNPTHVTDQHLTSTISPSVSVNTDIVTPLVIENLVNNVNTTSVHTQLAHNALRSTYMATHYL